MESIFRSKWMREKDMYPDVIKAIEGALHAPPSDLVVVDTSSKEDFPADISISEYCDSRLLHCMQYFFELNFPHLYPKMDSDEHCGQMFNYLNMLHLKQPHR